MVNFRHTDNVSSRGWEAKSAKGRAYSIPPESVGAVRGRTTKTRRNKKSAGASATFLLNLLLYPFFASIETRGYK